MRRISIIVTLLLGLNPLIKAQLNEKENIIPSIIPSSPQSKIFEKYIDHQIQEYNGLSINEIPLYEINIRGLKIPISLSYHSAGVKYRQFDGEVGAGWSIPAMGYRVSRDIHGKPDEISDFYDINEYCYPSKYPLLQQGSLKIFLALYSISCYLN